MRQFSVALIVCLYFVFTIVTWLLRFQIALLHKWKSNECAIGCLAPDLRWSERADRLSSKLKHSSNWYSLYKRQQQKIAKFYFNSFNDIDKLQTVKWNFNRILQRELRPPTAQVIRVLSVRWSWIHRFWKTFRNEMIVIICSWFDRMKKKIQFPRHFSFVRVLFWNTILNSSDHMTIPFHIFNSQPFDHHFSIFNFLRRILDATRAHTCTGKR